MIIIIQSLYNIRIHTYVYAHISMMNHDMTNALTQSILHTEATRLDSTTTMTAGLS